MQAHNKIEAITCEMHHTANWSGGIQLMFSLVGKNVKAKTKITVFIMYTDVAAISMKNKETKADYVMSY